MATLKATTYQNMLNEWLTYDLLKEEFKGGQNWLMKNCNWDQSWQGGDLIVPFQTAIASSVKMGSMTAETDIASAQYARGKLTGYKECYGSFIVNERDIMDHGKVNEQNFLKIFPDQLEDLIGFFRQTISIQVLGGKALDTANAALTVIATDVLYVNHPERFTIGQKIIVDDGAVAAQTGYVKAINKNTGLIKAVTTRGGSTDVDLAGMTLASIKIYTDGGNSTFMGSLRDMLLPAANGGSDTFCGQTKTDSTFAQGVLYNANNLTTTDWGSTTAVTANDILKLIFDALRKCRQRGAKPTVALMGYKHYHAALKLLENNSGAYKNIESTVEFADYSEMRVGGIAGSIKLVGIREFDDDWIALIDPKYLDFKTGKRPFEKITNPDGNSFYTIRSPTNGYQYITDLRLVGDFLYRMPWTGGAIYNIPSYAFNP